MDERWLSLSTDALKATRTGNNANAANTTLNAMNSTEPLSKTKLEEDAWLRWRQSKQNETKYPLLENDQMYTDWIVKIKRKFTSEEMSRDLSLSVGTTLFEICG